MVNVSLSGAGPDDVSLAYDFPFPLPASGVCFSYCAPAVGCWGRLSFDCGWGWGAPVDFLLSSWVSHCTWERSWKITAFSCALWVFGSVIAFVRLFIFVPIAMTAFMISLLVKNSVSEASDPVSPLACHARFVALSASVISPLVSGSLEVISPNIAGVCSELQFLVSVLPGSS